MPPIEKSQVAMPEEELASPFFGADDLDDEFEISPEDIAVRDGVPLNTDDGILDDSDDDVAPDDDTDDGDDTDADPVDDDSDADVSDDDDDTATDPDTANPDGDDDGAGDDTDDTQSKDTGSIMVPKSRMDSALRRAQAAEERLKQLEAGLTGDNPEGGDPLDLDGLEVTLDQEKAAKLADAYIDGKSDEAANILKDILSSTLREGLRAAVPALEKNLKTTVTRELSTVSRDTTSSAAFDEAVESVYAEYPMLNPESDQFNEEIMAVARTLQQGYQAQGKSAAVSVIAATQKVAQMYNLDAPAETAPAPKGRTAQDKDSRKRNASAARSQPPKDDGGSVSDKSVKADDTLNIDELTDDEFDALPESTKARLRGDFG